MFEFLSNRHLVMHIDSYFWGVLTVIAVLFFVIFLSLAGYYIAKYFLLGAIEKFSQIGKTPWLKSLYAHKVFHRLIFLIPVFILHLCAPLFAGISFSIIAILARPIQIITEGLILLIFAFAFSGFLNTIEDKYNKYQFSKQRPIKSTLQVIKILIFIITALLIASILLDKSLAYFITGLSAMTAVIILIFRDSILGFVTSIQLSAHDMISLGDWIEVPSFGADGTVLDISLNTIKIENFDKSIVMIPSTVFLSNSVKNWRRMSHLGARRIKRAIYIDVSSISFCEEKLINNLLHSKIKFAVDFSDLNSPKNFTNLGLLRFYLTKYLSERKDIHQDMIISVHVSEALNNGKGLPLEIYAFTPHTEWEYYEKTQSEIFEHIYAILVFFDLKAISY